MITRSVQVQSINKLRNGTPHGTRGSMTNGFGYRRGKMPALNGNLRKISAKIFKQILNSNLVTDVILVKSRKSRAKFFESRNIQKKLASSKIYRISLRFPVNHRLPASNQNIVDTIRTYSTRIIPMFYILGKSRKQFQYIDER